MQQKASSPHKFTFFTANFMVILFFKPFLKKKKYYIHVALKDRAKKNKNKLNKIIKKSSTRNAHKSRFNRVHIAYIYVLDNVHPFSMYTNSIV